MSDKPPPYSAAPYPQEGQYPPPQQQYPPPQQQHPPPQQHPQQQYPPPQSGQQPVHTQHTVVVAPTTTAVVRGGGNCPHCRVGNIVEDYSVLGIILAILFFPWGILCCLMMKDRRCSHCHVSF